MDFIALLIACLAAVGAAWVDRRSSERFEGVDTAHRAPYDDRAILTALDVHDDRLTSLREDQQTLAERIHDQNLAIAEGIQRVDRAERRVRSAVGRARKRLEEAGFVDDGLEAEAEQLREFDGSERPSEGVPPVRSNVADAPARDMSAFPGDWS